MYEWTARLTLEQEDMESNPAQSLDDNHTRKQLCFEAFLYSLHIITLHLHPELAYYRKFNIQLSITAYR